MIRKTEVLTENVNCLCQIFINNEDTRGSANMMLSI